MSDPWSERAEVYRTSTAHTEGPDLDLLVEWAAGARTTLDVATGGGHVARRLRGAGLEVVTCDPAPGMRPDVICAAEDLPFANRSFDLTVTRVAAHHFADVRAAARELARVAIGRMLVVDTLYMGEPGEEAERPRDPAHVRNYAEEEWHSFLEDAGLRVEEVRVLEVSIELELWLVRTGCAGETAARVHALLDDRISDGRLAMKRIALRAEVEA